MSSRMTLRSLQKSASRRPCGAYQGCSSLQACRGPLATCNPSVCTAQGHRMCKEGKGVNHRFEHPCVHALSIFDTCSAISS